MRSAGSSPGAGDTRSPFARSRSRRRPSRRPLKESSSSTRGRSRTRSRSFSTDSSVSSRRLPPDDAPRDGRRSVSPDASADEPATALRPRAPHAHLRAARASRTAIRRVSRMRTPYVGSIGTDSTRRARGTSLRSKSAFAVHEFPAQIGSVPTCRRRSRSAEIRMSRIEAVRSFTPATRTNGRMAQCAARKRRRTGTGASATTMRSPTTRSAPPSNRRANSGTMPGGSVKSPCTSSMASRRG